MMTFICFWGILIIGGVSVKLRFSKYNYKIMFKWYKIIIIAIRFFGHKK